MFGRITLVLLVLTAAALALGSAAYQEEVAQQAASMERSLYGTPPSSPLLPNVAAYAVFDPADGSILLAGNPDTTLPIASITKLFSAMVVHDMFDLEVTTTLQWSDLNAVGTAGKLQFGQEYTYRELLFPLLLSSSNNAALTLENRARERDMSLPLHMEQLATRYGYPAIKFADASGLSAANQATARDLAGLVAATRDDYSYIYNISNLSSYVGPYLGWKNNSPFIGNGAYAGGKHGFTNAAGRTSVALFSETIGEERVELGYIILGSNDLPGDMRHLRTQVPNLVEWR